MAPSDQFVKSAWMLASLALIVAALYLAKEVLVPMTLAVLLSFMLSPVCDWLERRRLGRIPAVLVTAIVGFAVLGLAAWTAVVQMTDLAPRMPEYQANVQAKLEAMNHYFVVALSKVTTTAEGMSDNLSQLEPAQEPQGTAEQPYAVRVVTSPASPLELFGGIFGTLVKGLGSAGIIVILVVFFLIRREDLRDRFIRLMGQGHVTLTTQMLEDAGTRVSRYLAMLFVINATYGIAVGIGLRLIGVPNSLLWGILAATLRFIPYIGAWIAAAMPIGLSLAVSSGWVVPIMTAALFVVLELFSNNVMEPWLYGRRTGVSAVAVLLAAVFWTWLWGIVGLLLATPLTVCLLVLGKHIPQLSFLDTLLGNEPVFEPSKRVYQRLLAGDQEEAAELLDEYLKRKPVVEVYDAVLLPALASAETHWHLGELDERRHKFILQSLKEIVEERHERQLELRGKEANARSNGADGAADITERTDSPQPCILCLPAYDEGDEIAGMMLAQVVGSRGCVAEAASSTATAPELLDLVEQRSANVVCISAAPPAAVVHARHLCMRLRRRFPEVHIVVGLWSSTGDLNHARERISHGAHVVTTLLDAQEKIRMLVQPLLLQTKKQVPTDDSRSVSTGSPGAI